MKRLILELTLVLFMLLLPANVHAQPNMYDCNTYQWNPAPHTVFYTDIQIYCSTTFQAWNDPCFGDPGDSQYCSIYSHYEDPPYQVSSLDVRLYPPTVAWSYYHCYAWTGGSATVGCTPDDGNPYNNPGGIPGFYMICDEQTSETWNIGMNGTPSFGMGYWSQIPPKNCGGGGVW